MVRLPGLAVLVVLAVLGAVLWGPAIGDTRPADDPAAAAQGASGIAAAQEGDRQEYELTVYSNGSTRWTMRYQRSLSNRTERENFEAYAERFNSEEVDLYEGFVRDAQRLVRLGADATGRRMEARSFRRDARVGPLGNQGIVEMSFLWTNFAETNDGEVAVGDVFAGGGLQGAIYVGPNQQFTIRTGGNLTFQSVQPDPDSTSGDSLEASDSVSWAGEREFDDGRPSAVLATRSVGGSSLGPAVLGAVLVLLGLAAAIAWRFGGIPGSRSNADSGSRSGTGPGAGPRSSYGTTPASGSGSRSGANHGSTGGGDGTSGGNRGDESSTGGSNSNAGSGPAPPPPPTEPAVSDEELLADDDRVVRLLEANGGRMRQVSIVEATDWSKSKVSMLLSEMESEERVSKLRIGRENIVSLNGYEPDTGGRTNDRN
jgi:hypothetical protein